jgi:carbamoyltransferase
MAIEEAHTRKVLGISAYYHDSAAALIVDGKIVAAAHEERFTRKKHDESFPQHAVRFVLSEYGLMPSQLDAVIFYDKPFLKFERLLEIYHRYVPKGVVSFVTSMPVWLKDKIFTRSMIRKELEAIEGGKVRVPLLFSEHHLSHAASAFYPSPFEEAAILTVDGVGEWATTVIAHGKGSEITLLKEMHFPHSLGLLYSAFTYYCGFKINSGEYKLMGLAPYGARGSERVALFKKKILDALIDLKDDGSLFLTMGYFRFAEDLRTTDDIKWEELFGIPPRKPESPLTQEYMDLALAIQEVTNDVMVLLARTAKKLTGATHLVMAGGVALNCVSNEKILDAKIFDSVWIQPAAGDAGGALGAALAAEYGYFGGSRHVDSQDSMQGSYLGPQYAAPDIERMIRRFGASAKTYEVESLLYTDTAKLIAQGNVVGWMQGRMEWGPRALGNRSIIADPRSKDMQKKLNLKIKYREGFRPFAPSVLEEDAGEYFDLHQDSPYMLLTAPVTASRRRPAAPAQEELSVRLNTPRSDIPSVTHLDYSARVQTVSKKTNPRYWNLIDAFKRETGYGLLVNTSFNVRGEPIVMTPEDAYRCFMNTEMDYLVVGDYLFAKADQPHWEKADIEKTYGLD